MTISIIIPTINESENIGKLVFYFRELGNALLKEIIVIDGGSTDNTVELAENAGAKVISSPQKGRAYQMNLGASIAEGDILYFVHADTLPPTSCLTDIMEALQQGFEMGRFLSQYDSSSFLLKINAYFSKYDWFAGMGGDQTLFITKSLFNEAGGFNGTLKIMEDFEFCARARQNHQYKIISKPVLISARKYIKNAWLKVQIANYTVVKMYKNGANQESMYLKYKELLNT